MDNDTALIVATIHDYFDGWFDGDAPRMARALHRVHLVRTRDGWKIANALWCTP